MAIANPTPILSPGHLSRHSFSFDSGMHLHPSILESRRLSVFEWCDFEASAILLSTACLSGEIVALSPAIKYSDL